MKDSWCQKLVLKGISLYGGAARNVRIARAGGMDNIISDAVKYALERADAVVHKNQKAKVHHFKVG